MELLRVYIYSAVGKAERKYFEGGPPTKIRKIGLGGRENEKKEKSLFDLNIENNLRVNATKIESDGLMTVRWG